MSTAVQPTIDAAGQLKPVAGGGTGDGVELSGPETGGSVPHVISKHASVNLHSYSRLPFTLTQSQVNESNTSPQHASVVPSEQLLPSSTQVSAWAHMTAATGTGGPVTTPAGGPVAGTPGVTMGEGVSRTTGGTVIGTTGGAVRFAGCGGRDGRILGGLPPVDGVPPVDGAPPGILMSCVLRPMFVKNSTSSSSRKLMRLISLRRRFLFVRRFSLSLAETVFGSVVSARMAPSVSRLLADGMFDYDFGCIGSFA